MIYTSYYANIKNIPSDWNLIGISNTIPTFRDRYIFRAIRYIPNWSIVGAHKRGEITDEQFEIEYIKYLDMMIDERSKFQLKGAFDSNKVMVFLCYEKPPKFCHRHILARYLNEKLRVNIQEFNP